MKKMDEMDRNIQLRSEELGYKAVLIALCAWVLFNVYQTLANGVQFEILPCLILCLAVSVQGFSQLAMKTKMIAGDEEYKEPNQFAQAVLVAVVSIVAILSAGMYLFLKR